LNRGGAMARPIPPSAHRLGQDSIVAVVVALCLVIALGAAEPAGAASLPGTVSFVSPLHASQDKFTPRGGVSTLTAQVASATSCSLSLSPAIAGAPKKVACTGAGAVSIPVDFPVNPLPEPVTYRATLSATDATATVTSSTTVVVEGFRWLGVMRDRAGPVVVTAESCANPNDLPPQSKRPPPCVEVGRDGEAAYVQRSVVHWADVDGAVPFVAVSCVPGSIDFCVALDARGDYVVFNGTAWTTPAPFAEFAGTPLRLGSIICDSLPASAAFANQCVAVDANGHVAVVTFGSTNTVVTSTVPLRGPSFVACATPELCMAVDRAGVAVLMSASGAWTRNPVRVDVVSTVTDATCTPDQHTCVVTDSSGGIVDFELAGLHPVGIERHTTSELVGRRTGAVGAACGMSYCLAVLANGALVQGVRGAWSEVRSMSLHAGDQPVTIASATQATSVWCSVVTHGWRDGAAFVSRTDAGLVIPVI
jgi:hypothetical protein